MKKKVLIIFPYKFTEFIYYKLEIKKLKKKYSNCDVLIHDISDFISSKSFNNEWKTKAEKSTLKFSSLLSWINAFKNIKKENLIIFNFVSVINFQSFMVNFLLRIYKIPIIYYFPVDPFSTPEALYKKNVVFLFSRIKEHGLNINVYFYTIKNFIYRKIIKLIKFENVFLLSNNFQKVVLDDSYCLSAKKIIKIDINNYDYSNAISIKYKKKKKKNFIIYLDCGVPYFKGDSVLTGFNILETRVKEHYDYLNKFFDNLESYFNSKVVVIPHPKYKSPNKNKIKSLNPYFNKRLVNNEYDSLAKLSPNCNFFINNILISTAITYAVIHSKPILQIYSSKYSIPRESKDLYPHMNRLLDSRSIDICNYKISDIKKRLKVNKKKYKNFKYQFLTPKSKSYLNTENYKLLGKLINGDQFRDSY